MGPMRLVRTEDVGLCFREDCGDNSGQIQEVRVIVASGARGECCGSFARREHTRSRCEER